jgi:hypothetical protein
MSIAPFMMSVMAAALTTAAPPFDIPSGDILLSVQASGAQIYECKATGWTFREPIAALMRDGKTIGRHYAGPSWALDDGSVVTGKLATSVAGPTAADIPQLKLDVASHAGHGLLDSAKTVYRVATQGGRLAGPCATPGEIKAVPYAATYVFTR